MANAQALPGGWNRNSASEAQMVALGILTDRDLTSQLNHATCLSLSGYKMIHYQLPLEYAIHAGGA